MTAPSLTPTTEPPASGVASWYVPGPTDAIGDRLVMFDNTSTPPLELLRVHRHVASIPGFETALRSRVAELRGFRHPSFPAVRAVQHLEEDGSLAIVSEHTAGQRLSEFFHQQPRAPLQPAVVAWLLRELTAALAALQATAPGSFHGALTPDRIVLTPDGRLCILEHALGPALARAAQAAEPGSDHPLAAGADAAHGGTTLDARSDVVQLAAIAMSMLIARPVSAVELQSRLPALLDEAAAADAALPPHVAPLRGWFERALHAGGGGYRDAADAHDAARQLPRGSAASAVSAGRAAPGAPADVAADRPAGALPSSSPGSGRARRASAPSIEELMREPFPSEREGTVGSTRHSPAQARGARPRASHAFADQGRQTAVERGVEGERAASRPDVTGAWGERGAARIDPAPEDGQRASAITRRRSWLLGAMVLAVAAQSVAIGVLVRRDAPAPARTVLIESDAEGDRVIVNGEEAGLTPLPLEMDAETRSVRIRSAAGTRPSPAAD
jgi:hypothetical protein